MKRGEVGRGVAQSRRRCSCCARGVSEATERAREWWPSGAPAAGAAGADENAARAGATDGLNERTAQFCGGGRNDGKNLQ